MDQRLAKTPRMNLRPLLFLAAALAIPAVVDHAAAQGLPAPDSSGIWTLQGENATISAGTPTDRLYVNGLRIGYTTPTGQVPDFLGVLGKALWGPAQMRMGIDLTQMMFTPIDTAARIPSPYDRPYAGVLMGNLALIGDSQDTRSVLMLSLGVLGPAAGAKEVQNGFHALIGQDKNNGWDSQISNQPVINILHERTWRLPMGTVAGLETDALPSLTMALGTLRDYVQTGVTFRIGQGLNSDFGVPRIRPGLSGGDVFTPTRDFAWYVFAGVDGQAVAYDMTLNAHPLRGGPHVSSIWDIAEFQGGVALMAYGMRLTFAYVAQTPEYNGQSGGLHQFGSAALSVRF